METLVSDLKKIVQGSADLVSRVGSLQSPSWKFPEQLGVSLDVGKALDSGSTLDESSSHFFVLELVIDRLLLVLQCCVSELESVNGRKSSNFPLTLGSTVKRLSKCIIQNSSHSLKVKEQLATKTNQIDSLNSSLFELQQQYKQLLLAVAGTPFDPTQNSDQDIANLTGTNADALPKSTDACVQTTDTAFALCAQCNETQLALVDSAQLISRLCDRNLLKSKFSSCDWNTQMKVGRLDVANWYGALQADVASLDERSCLLMRSVEDLNLERDKLEEGSQKLKNKMHALEMQLNSLKDLENRCSKALTKSKKEFAASVSQLESSKSELQSRNARMKEKLEVSNQRVLDLSAAMKELEASRGQLEVELHGMETREQELQDAKQNLEDQLESVMRQSQEALNDRQLELNKSKMYTQTQEKKYEAMKTKQSTLLSRLDSLDEECTALKEELMKVEDNREKLANDLQQVRAQYKEVQQQLNSEQNKLSASNQEQEKLSVQLTALQVQLSNAKEEIKTEKENCRSLMDYPFVKQSSESYSDHVTSLTRRRESRKQITANTIRILLLEEQNHELRHTAVTEARELKEKHVDLESSQVSHPLPLWEHELVADIQDQRSGIAGNSAGKKPPWSPQQREQEMGTEQLIFTRHSRKPRESRPTNNRKLRERDATNASSSVRTSSAQRVPQSSGGYSDTSEPQRRLRSAGVGQSSMKGRLGHLKRAVADAHRNNAGSGIRDNDDIEQPMDIEVFLCDKCDRMFCHADELYRHNSSCDGVL